MKVGNGESCRFWSDIWSPFGKLFEYLLPNQRSGMGIRPSKTLADLFSMVAGDSLLHALRVWCNCIYF